MGEFRARLPARGAAQAILAAAILVCLPGLASLDLWAPDEPRFAQVAQELASGAHGPSDAIVLHLNGEIYTQKPPLYYWTAAGFGALFGRVTEVAARLPSALAAVAVVALTLALGRSLFGRASTAGLWAAAALLSTPRFVHLARRAQLDVILTLFEGLALLAFWQLAEGHAGRDPARRRRGLLLLHGSLGLAVLTKGPVGLLPLAVMGAYLVWQGRGRELRDYVPAWGLTLAVGPALLWVTAAVALAPAGYFDEAIVENLVGRFFAGTSHPRPFYYYLYQLPADFLPWTLALPAASLHALRRAQGADTPYRDATRLLMAWVGVFLVFFSLSAGKRGLYLLPCFPALALACGAWLEGALPAVARLRRWLSAGGVGAALAVAGGGAWLAVQPAPGFEAAPGLFLPRSFGAVAAAIAGAAVAAAWRAPAGRQLTALIAALIALEVAAFALLLPAFDEQKSPRPIAIAAEAAATKSEQDSGAPIGIFLNASLVGGIAYYAGQAVTRIDGPAQLDGFLAAGGRVLITRRRDLAALRGAVDAEIVASLRAGRREILVTRAHPPADPY